MTSCLARIPGYTKLVVALTVSLDGLHWKSCDMSNGTALHLRGVTSNSTEFLTLTLDNVHIFCNAMNTLTDDSKVAGDASIDSM